MRRRQRKEQNIPINTSSASTRALSSLLALEANTLFKTFLFGPELVEFF